MWSVCCTGAELTQVTSVVAQKQFGIQVAEDIVLPSREVKERFVRAAGARGQNARRLAIAVELRLDIEKSSLPSSVKERLIVEGGRHVTADRVLVVVSRVHGSQAQNRVAARELLSFRLATRCHAIV